MAEGESVSIKRWAARRDETEKPIVDGLQALGYQVRRQDVPDLIVRKPDWPAGQVMLLEVDGITKHRKRGLAQLGFLRAWRVPVVKTFEEAARALGVKIS
jgi:hypothetical protein